MTSDFCVAINPIAEPNTARTAELERLGDEIAELAAHLDAATARLLDLIRVSGLLGQDLRAVTRGEPIEFLTFDGHADNRLRLAAVVAGQGRLRDSGQPPGHLARRLSRAGRMLVIISNPGFMRVRISSPVRRRCGHRMRQPAQTALVSPASRKGALTLRAMMEVARGEPIVTAA